MIMWKLGRTPSGRTHQHARLHWRVAVRLDLNSFSMHELDPILVVITWMQSNKFLEDTLYPKHDTEMFEAESR
jgi:hypothetical protein